MYLQQKTNLKKISKLATIISLTILALITP
jgi:hypothetical protein